MTTTHVFEGDVAFHDNYVPSLEAGNYKVTVESGIEGLDTKDYFKAPIVQSFEVRAPQFSLLTTEIHAVYPPNDSYARYSKVLPHVVLNKRGLPWERIFIEERSEIPWLCVLVFKEGEIEVDEQGNVVLCQSTVAEFLKPTQGILKPQISQKTIADDVLASQCNSIKVDADILQLLAPKVEELAYLTHVRQVDADNQAITDYDEHDWFSVAVANRFLESGEQSCKYYMHLVSLEGYDVYLTESFAEQSLPDTVQLISLYNWSCVSQPEFGKSFAELVENFLPKEGGADDLMLRHYPQVSVSNDDASEHAQQRLKNGYVPLAHQLATGEQTFAWYRGPCSPVIPQDIPRIDKSYHYPSADSAMIYDDKYGVFDHSYAAAWTVGRLLALNHANFSQAVFRNRKESYQILGSLVDSLKHNPELLNGNLQSAVENNGGVARFRQLLKDGIGKTISTVYANIDHRKQDSSDEPEQVSAHPIILTKQLLKNAAAYAHIQANQSSDDEQTITYWLGRKQLLYDVPFNHIVADEKCLPVESLRFFYFDQNWIDMLIDGALSIGVHSSKDISFNHMVRHNWTRTASKKAALMRKQMLQRHSVASDSNALKRPTAGLLIRSSVLVGWPGLIVEGFIDDKSVEILRIDHLSDTVLLCLFSDIPEKVTFTEPQQGLHFGIDDYDQIVLRYLEGEIGAPFENLQSNKFPDQVIEPAAQNGFKKFYRNPQAGKGQSVLDINRLVNNLEQTLRTATDKPALELSPAGFAIQMVKAPERLTFAFKSPSNHSRANYE